jgi:FkbM family methyltransferase
MSEYMMKVIREKRYESQEARQLQRIIQENEVVLEIGAGIGFMASLIANNPLTKRVVSYEANSSLIPIIRDTVKSNTGKNYSKWDLRHAVLATGYKDQSDLDFFVHRDFWASSLSPIADAVRVEKVTIESFNDVITNVRPTLIVCDIEGGELELFKNADLSGVKKVYLEVHQKILGRRGVRALFECFHSRDFSYDPHHSESSVVLFSHVDRDKK